MTQEQTINRKNTQKTPIKNPRKPTNTSKSLTPVKKTITKDEINTDAEIDNAINDANKYDFTEAGFKTWYKNITPEIKATFEGQTNIGLPDAALVESIKSQDDNMLNTLLQQPYKKLVFYGRIVRVRMLSLILQNPKCLKSFVKMVNIIEKFNKPEGKDLYQKATLLAKDMSAASKSVLGNRIASTIYRDATVELFYSTMGTFKRQQQPKTPTPAPTQTAPQSPTATSLPSFMSSPSSANNTPSQAAPEKPDSTPEM